MPACSTQLFELGVPMTEYLDNLIRQSLTDLAADPHVRTWRAKESNWVNYYAHRHLLRRCAPDTPFFDPAQLGIEIAVPQPSSRKRLTAPKDLVIWSTPGSTCWSDDWTPCVQPLLVSEWKVHRPGRRNREIVSERHWLAAYCAWQPTVLAFAVEIDLDRAEPMLTCCRFSGETQYPGWLSTRIC
jgi:hypothetical protein